MPVEVQPPSPDSYQFVLRHDDWDPTVENEVISHDETRKSLPIRFKGKIAPTIFAQTEGLKIRASFWGWVDITDEWRASLAAVVEAEPEPEPETPKAPPSIPPKRSRADARS